MKVYVKFLIVCQLAIGLLLIAIPLYTLSDIRIVTEEPAEISMIVEALQGASPTPKQAQQGAKILTMQRDSLKTIASAAKDASRGLEYCGAFIVFSGIVLLIVYVRKR